MSDSDYRAGVMLGRLIRLAADLSLIAIGVVLCLSAAGAVTIR